MTERRALGAIVVLGTALLVLGWWTFWFLCDDAYISFRYVANRQAGFGYTWNPPPFRPVEGYTSFLWVVILDLAWTITGRPPPETANALGLACAWLTLVGAAAVAWGLPYPPEARRARPALVALAVLGVVSNRTFLAFASSGLETAMFGLLVLAWLALATRVGPGPGRAFGLALTAGLLPLARPDGLLYLAATVVLALAAARRDRSPAALLAHVPLLLPAIHLGWRRVTYGAWLPNTWQAKQLEPWPEAGLAYLASFALEYAVWAWAAVALIVAVRSRARPTKAGLERAVPWLTFAAHLGYYTLVVGGDHFEYRVYQPWIPVIWVTLPLFLARLVRPSRAVAGMVVALGLSWPIPWVHWWHTDDLATRRETRRLVEPVAPHLPISLVARGFDGLQAWLIDHLVGVRHPTHREFLRDVVAKTPARREPRPLPDDVPVIAEYSIGYLAYALGDIAVIDRLGLNDAYVARAGVRKTGARRMAHDLRAPDDYLACFRPNVVLVDGEARVGRRAEPLTHEDVRRCEATFWARLGDRAPGVE